MLEKIIHANIYTPDEFLPDHSITIENGTIRDIYPTTPSEKETTTAFDAKNQVVTPGLIDIHIHGCKGADTMDGTLNALNTMSVFLATHGVTGFLATTASDSQENIENALENIAQHQMHLQGAHLLGVHIEGPYLNPAFKGAQNPAFLRLPARSEYEAWLATGTVKLITIAPELPGMDEMILACREHGVELSIGHSSASYAQVIHAAELGVRQATHLFNGMQGLHHREPGTVGGILTDERIIAQIICDGIHLHPAIVKLILLCKGIDQTILISDAIRATGLTDGIYDLAGQEVTVSQGVARIANGSLAGSTLTLDVALRNAMQFSGFEFSQILAMTTRVPTHAMHLSSRKGYIRKGYDADLAIFDHNFHVVSTIVSGSQVYYEDKTE